MTPTGASNPQSHTYAKGRLVTESSKLIELVSIPCDQRNCSVWELFGELYGFLMGFPDQLSRADSSNCRLWSVAEGVATALARREQAAGVPEDLPGRSVTSGQDFVPEFGAVGPIEF